MCNVWLLQTSVIESALFIPVAKNVSVAVGCGAVRGVCWCILSSQNLQLTESVVMVLLHLLNKPSTRKYLRPGSELLSLLAPITDIHYQHTVDNWEDAKKIHFLRFAVCVCARVCVCVFVSVHICVYVCT